MRSRDEILREVVVVAIDGEPGAETAFNINQGLVLEVMLDIRDQLVDIRLYTESTAVWVERGLPEANRADPPIAEFQTAHSAEKANEMLRAGWIAAGSAVDPHGDLTILLSRRAR